MKLMSGIPFFITISSSTSVYVSMSHEYIIEAYFQKHDTRVHEEIDGSMRRIMKFIFIGVRWQPLSAML
ncbi:hypothetical protein L1987_52243 [Smallanthus sonchifolius]|uniref:Uncharacterized protein n=1 Tax=Smallanthus sonchifolius TaxID=185202 RepID=A0ACB9ESY2_9ASTR|nr:hypothetical protein L1987_52243 [Smallanthus sonchifolius]